MQVSANVEVKYGNRCALSLLLQRVTFLEGRAGLLATKAVLLRARHGVCTMLPGDLDNAVT